MINRVLDFFCLLGIHFKGRYVRKIRGTRWQSLFELHCPHCGATWRKWEDG